MSNSCQVFYENLKIADETREEFEDMAKLDEDAAPFFKAFTVHDYERTESEIIELAHSSWLKFKQSSKQIILV